MHSSLEIIPTNATKSNFDIHFNHKKYRVYQNMDSGDVIGHTSFRERPATAEPSVKVGYVDKKEKPYKFQKRFGYSMDFAEPRPTGIRQSPRTSLSSRTVIPETDAIVSPRAIRKNGIATPNNPEYFVYDPSQSPKYLVQKPKRKLDVNKLQMSPRKQVDPVFPVVSIYCSTAMKAPQLKTSPRISKSTISGVSYNILAH
jgi:hypothetical protein